MKKDMRISCKIEINQQFGEALSIMEEGKRNLFITGKAGTGKSTLLNYFRERTKKQVVVLAPTGVAAVNIKGQTIHSFFGFRPDVTIEKARRAAKKVVNSDAADVYRKMQTLIVDEISMVRADLFDCIDEFLRVAREKKLEPFGGVQVVMIGDLYQLPPVVTSRDREVFAHHYTSPYFFDSKVFPKMDAQLLELEKIYRQSDNKFVELLNAVRNNTIDDDGIEFFNRTCVGRDFSDGENCIHLTSLNRDADEINNERLLKLSGKSYEFDADISGSFNEKSYPADSVVRLKSGAQVMLLNNDQLGRWINGTIGTVVGIGKESVNVKLDDGVVHEVEPHTWQMFHFGLDEKSKKIVSEAVGKFTQIPIMLAWAVTIHKSQGKTFDRATIDVGRAFSAGQVYVALSRLRTIDGMALFRPLKKSHVRVDWRVVKFLTSHHYAISDKAIPLDQKIKIIEQTIEDGEALEILYLKASDVKSKRVIKPLQVGKMEYLGKPFLGLRALCSLSHEERTFRVDRILEMKKITPSVPLSLRGKFESPS